MISALIPTYNYNVYPLVRELHKQLSKAGIEFEIIVFDDASEQSFETDQLIAELPRVIYKKMAQNQGRLALRYQMAQTARYDQLLMLDADMFPKDRFFVLKLLKIMEKHPADIYFGGINVPPNPPSDEKMLRWKYGKHRESLSLEKRRQQPYKSLLCGALSLKKAVFLNTAKPLLPIKRYGLDVYFSYLLKQQHTTVWHYQNPVTHLGLEANMEFLKKTRDAVETYHFLISHKKMPADYIKLTKIGEKIKKWLPYPFRKCLFKCKKPFIEWQLNTKNPSLFLFDIYKLLYYLQLK